MPYGLGAVCVYQRLGQRVCWSAAKAGYWDVISLVGKEPELLCLRVNRCWLDIIRAHLTTWFELWN